VPEKFVDELPAVFADALPMPGEEARYTQVLAVLALKQVMTEAVEEADRELVAPLFEFRNYGEQLPDHWSTISNEAAFRSDYFTRTAVAKSNILVNSPNETKYFPSGPGRWRSAQRRQAVYGHVREGPDPSCQRVLVAHALQPAPLFRTQQAQPLFTGDQKQVDETESGQLADDLCPSGQSRI
jgi:hypothetical protein